MAVSFQDHIDRMDLILSKTRNIMKSKRPPDNGLILLCLSFCYIDHNNIHFAIIFLLSIVS